MKVLITGSSSGIGEAFAYAFAQQSCDVILHGRREEKLSVVADHVREISGRDPLIIVGDLGEKNVVSQLVSVVTAEDFDVLINNAGFWNPKRLWLEPVDSLDLMIDVHIRVPLLLMRTALPGMLIRKHGIIINVSTVAATFSSSLMENYSATKSYLDRITKALHVSLVGTGVSVQLLVPGLTITDFHRRLGFDPRLSKRRWLTADEVVRKSFQALKRNKPVCYPHPRDHFLVWILNRIPQPLYFWYMYRFSKSLAKKWGTVARHNRESGLSENFDREE